MAPNPFDLRFLNRPQPAATSSSTGPPANATVTGQPPRYQVAMSKVYPYSLRPVLFITSILGLVWALILGIGAIRDRGDDFETAKMKLFDIIFAALYFVVAAVEVFGIVCSIFPKVGLARLLIPLAPLGVVVATADQVVAIVAHFNAKGDIINQCVQNTQGKVEIDDFGSTGTSIDHDRAVDLCNGTWRHNTWTVFGWLIFTLLVSILFASIAITYYRQVLDPASMKPMRNNQNQSFPMRPPPPGGFQGQEQPWMVPPYPGPPAGGVPYEKSDYHPGAEWANDGPSYQYAPPAGSPPRRQNPSDSTEGLVTDAQEEAWQRARSEGVTAHLTGHGPTPRGGRDEEEGYAIPNREEDEAWERARTEGVTAHLTGQASTSAGRKGDTVV